MRSQTTGTVSDDEVSAEDAGADVVQERVRFAGPAGQLAGELAYPNRNAPSFAALIAGPHPYMGGTMANRLVECLAIHLAAVGGVSLRFDYGGTGDSDGRPIDVAASMSAFWETGHAPEDPDRVEDAAAAAAYVASLAAPQVVLVGYSFGCYAAARGWRSSTPAGVVLISPTVSRHELGFLRHWEAPTFVVHSNNDFATPADSVKAWFDTLPEPKRRLCMDDGDHFFRGAEESVAAMCADFVLQSAVEVPIGTEDRPA